LGAVHIGEEEEEEEEEYNLCDQELRTIDLKEERLKHQESTIENVDHRKNP